MISPPRAAALAVCALVAYAFVNRLTYLLASPYPLGIDGYFYPIQLRSLLETGRLYYPSAPLAPWLMAPLAFLTSPIVGAKIGAALGTSLATIPAYVLAHRLTQNRPAALLSAALTATSGAAFYLSTEFVKEGIGLTFALGYFAALAVALDTKKTRHYVLAGFFLLATLLAHKSAFGLAVLVSLPLLAVRHLEWAALAVLLTVGLGVLAPHRFLSVADIHLLRHLFSTHAFWSLPVLAMPGGTPLHLGYEVPIAAGLALACLTRREKRLAMALAAYAIFVALPWIDVSNEQGLGYRLRLSAFVPLGLLAAIVCARLQHTALQHAAIRHAAIPLAILTIAARPAVSKEGVVGTHPALVAGVRATSDVLPPDALVICPDRQVAFMTTWYGRAHVRLTAPRDLNEAATYRLLPGALISEPLANALDELRNHPRPEIPPPIDLHPWGKNGLVILTEKTYQAVRPKLP